MLRVFPNMPAHNIRKLHGPASASPLIPMIRHFGG
jgi:hypothetical protein